MRGIAIVFFTISLFDVGEGLCALILIYWRMIQMAEVKVTADNFETEVLKADRPVIVDFWATWCGPCRMLAPVLEEIDREYGDKVKICKVNVDEEPALADRFKVSAIPTLYIFKDGKIARSSMGYKKKEEILKLVF